MPCWRIGHYMPLPKLEKRHHCRMLCRSSLYLLWQKNKLIHHHYVDPSLNGTNVCKSNQSALGCSLSDSEKHNLIGTKIHMECLKRHCTHCMMQYFKLASVRSGAHARAAIKAAISKPQPIWREWASLAGSAAADVHSAFPTVLVALATPTKVFFSPHVA